MKRVLLNIFTIMKLAKLFQLVLIKIYKMFYKTNVYSYFLLQEKTNAVRALAQQHRLAIQQEQSLAEQSRSMGMTTLLPTSGSISPGPIPNATLDLSAETPTPPEICTLV